MSSINQTAFIIILFVKTEKLFLKTPSKQHLWFLYICSPCSTYITAQKLFPFSIQLSVLQAFPAFRAELYSVTFILR